MLMVSAAATELSPHQPGYQIVKLGTHEAGNHLLTGGGQHGAVLLLGQQTSLMPLKWPHNI